MIGRLAAHIGRIAAWNAERLAARARRNVVLAAVSGLFGATAYGAVLVAGTLWLAGQLGLPGALAIVGVVSAALAVLVATIAVAINATERRREAEVRRASAETVSTALTALPMLKGSNLAVMAAAGAALAYFALGNNGSETGGGEAD
ncbi:hypothetical protein [Nisaea sediminum]|uniref:hypothetical protein n=1 Tax=Nisaea sediminum TaxID=2775867 RepID=UPI00186677D9|nr:hypothetical protein [Nisaea sediminum]